jgi:hypothetical protein
MHQIILAERRSSRTSPSCATPLATTAPETKSAEAGGGNPPDGPPTAALDGPNDLSAVSPRIACRIVRQLTSEMTAIVCDRPLVRRDSRRSTCHIRQISMYVCHVVLRLSLSDIGAAFGRDRTTVGHACNVVEDRRDDAAFDQFVSSIERVVLCVFGPAGLGGHE